MPGSTDLLTHLENALWRASDHLLLYHTNPWELDDALKNAGFDMGPCEVRDHVGLMHVLEREDAHFGPVLSRMVNEGRLGKISGVGFYRYPGGGGAVVDPLIEDLILEEAHFGKLARRDMSEGEVLAFVGRALREAIGAQTLERPSEGAAQRLRLSPKLLECLLT